MISGEGPVSRLVLLVHLDVSPSVLHVVALEVRYRNVLSLTLSLNPSSNQLALVCKCVPFFPLLQDAWALLLPFSSELE